MSPINCKYFCIGLTFINNLDHKRMCHEIWEFLVSNRRCGDWEGGNNEIFVQPATSLTLFQGACRFCERLGVCLVYHFAKGVLKVTIFINVFKNRTRLFRMTFGIWSRDGYMYSVDRGTWPFFTKKKHRYTFTPISWLSRSIWYVYVQMLVRIIGMFSNSILGCVPKKFHTTIIFLFVVEIMVSSLSCFSFQPLEIFNQTVFQHFVFSSFPLLFQ